MTRTLAAILIAAGAAFLPSADASAQGQGSGPGPAQSGTPAAAEPPADTAGTYLMNAWKAARRKYPDALFLSASASTDGSGTPICSPQSPFQNGWRYTFYSPAQEAYPMMAACAGSISGPLVQMRSKDAKDPRDFTISGKFIDSAEALDVLAAAKVPLDPGAHGAMGKRPFSLQLHRLDDERFSMHPAVWKIEIGKDSYLVDAVHGEMLSPLRYGVSLIGGTTNDVNLEVLSRRPRKAKIYTAKKDYDRVIAYGKKRFPGAQLMAIEGFVDAWGASPCTGSGDGWAFYFYRPDEKDYEVLYACDGKIGPGPTQYIPVNPKEHVPLTNPFVDSDKIIEVLLSHQPGSMNEGLGRDYTRTGVLLLRQYKDAPLAQAGVWDVHLLWQVTLGRVKYRFDGRTGKILDMRE